ncbi:hypothetical protein B0A49_07694 [Cryomyces minteri]|uniref:Uncharacterized protein n=1 Tax=Cryomyces minteri TaxID=331657 RepID=A0A4U0X609_9PEZI|nr:hypothetical protein B0A49_07694 [Cryomyces minteri]
MPSSSHSNGGGSAASGLFSRKGSSFFHARGQQSSSPPAPSSTATTPPNPGSTPRSHKRESFILSLSSSVTDLGTSVRRSVSLRSRSSYGSNKTRSPPSNTLSFSYSPEKGARSVNTTLSKPSLSLGHIIHGSRSSETLNYSQLSPPEHIYNRSPLSAVDPPKSAFGTMPAATFGHNLRRLDTSEAGKTQNTSNGQGGATLSPPLPNPPLQASAGANNPRALHQHINDTASKRIATLDYLRKAHEGHLYYFKTLQLSPSDLPRLPSLSPSKQARRAAHYLLLGYSLPTVLDLNAANPSEYLRALNALLAEFEAYQSVHGFESSSSLSRARIPQMFKGGLRGTSGAAKSRKGSADDADTWGSGGFSGFSGSSSSSSTAPQPSQHHHHTPPATEPASSDLLHAGESYTHLLTPSLPFDPDFYETFATLCDVLIDAYTRLLALLGGPADLAREAPGMAELFQKADARIRKVLLAGVVGEFGEEGRRGVKSEMAGVGRVVLGGLM